MKLFVYGTIKEGYGNNHHVSHGKKIGDSSVEGFKLYYSGFPVAAPSEGDVATGEVWEVDDNDLQTVRNLDALEGVSVGMYSREKVKTTNGHECWMYVGGVRLWKNFENMRECEHEVVDDKKVYTWRR